jgi:1,4-dihydroxy-6-naphthoate synthase
MDELIDSTKTFAVPGKRTSALAALKILAGERPLDWQAVPFTEIMDRVSNQEFVGGVVIHEGQLTYEDHGLYEICDLGKWWHERTNLPLPLGGNSIKRDIDSRFGEGATKQVTSLLLQSIEFAMENREKSLRWATKWGRGIDMACTDEFVEMYVNKWTLDFGEEGRKAVQVFLEQAAEVRAVPTLDSVIFV